MTRTVRAAGGWLVTDSGAQSGARNMEIDRRALDAMIRGAQAMPVVRFFQWEKPVITYGYLLDKAKVKAYADENGGLPVVQRPTGGGAVIHQPSDLSLALLWPRRSGLLPDLPTQCYAEIHAALRSGVRRYLGDALPSLFNKDEACETGPRERFSVCFDEPVCNDVMLGGRKIVGGALRVTKQAMLYQGNVQLKRTVNLERLKNCLLSALMELVLQPAVGSARPAGPR